MGVRDWLDGFRSDPHADVVAAALAAEPTAADARVTPPEPNPVERTLTARKGGQTTNSGFFIAPDHTGVEIPGPGRLEHAIIQADTDQFGVSIITDEAALAAGSWSDLQPISAHDPDLAVTQTDDEYTIVVEDAPYRDYSIVEVRPMDDVTFSIARAKWTVTVDIPTRGGFG